LDYRRWFEFKKLTRSLKDLILLPESGEPTRTAMPWNNEVSPNALFNFSSPSISTMTIDRRAMKQAKANDN